MAGRAHPADTAFEPGRRGERAPADGRTQAGQRAPARERAPAGEAGRSGEAFAALAAELKAHFRRGVEHPLPDAAFDAFARRAFEIQFEASAVYRAFCRGRGVDPGNLTSWEEIPAVPAEAFKRLDLVAGDPGDAARVFVTSGTTSSSGLRGRHFVLDLDLYRASLLPNFAAHVLPGVERPPLLSLIPSPAEAPTSSLSFMIGVVAEELAGPTAWLVDGRGGLDAEAFLAAAGEHGDAHGALLVTGTAFSFVHLIDGLNALGRRAALPAGSRIMETGGFKGRSRSVSGAELYRAIEEVLGVAERHVVNEYGMTELLSQLYEPTLLRTGAAQANPGPGSEPDREAGSEPDREAAAVPGRGVHMPPPWLRVRALDPVTLEPLEAGREGLLCFFDLANAGSVCHILTEDLGSVTPEGVRLRGRVVGAEPRGCSRAMDEVLSAAEAGAR